MQWDFWNRNKKEAGVKFPKPKELISDMGRKMVVSMQYDPDWVWGLKFVKTKNDDMKNSFKFRIFDPMTAKVKGVSIINYNSLDDQPDLILFDGWYNQNTREIDINDYKQSAKNKTVA